jgi:sec-independent protein translocase protein TatB
MFGVGFWELFLLFLLALIVLGPERLPVAARKLGYWAGRARAVAGAVRDQLEQEVADIEYPTRTEAPKIGSSENLPPEIEPPESERDE